MKTVRQVLAVPDLRGQRINLVWQNPPASDFSITRPLQGIRILRRERTFPMDENDGLVVYDGQPIDQFSDEGLAPLTTYYYTIFTFDNEPAFFSDTGANVAAFSTADYSLAERLYSMLPATHQRSDILSQAEISQMDAATLNSLQALPAGLGSRGPLRRFFATTFSAIDLMRSLAEGLRQQHDLDRALPEFIPLAGDWLGWNMDFSQPLYEQRNEVKAAPRLYRSVGTVPNLVALVNRYTGWHAQAAEFMQSIARSNIPAQLNLFALIDTGAGWRATDDAANVLGFGAGNDLASGGVGLRAVLVGNRVEPFPLFPRMELAVTTDDHLPVVVRFGESDFTDMSAATAVEVAGVINRTLSEVVAIARGDGHLELRSGSVGPASALSLRAEASRAALITLEGAPRGRLSTLLDRTHRLRLFYGAFAPETGTNGVPGVSQIRHKCFRDRAWGDSVLVPADPGGSQAEPAVVELHDGSLFLTWVENPGTPMSRLRFRLGQPGGLLPAQLVGRRNAPFNISPGSILLLRTHRPLPMQFIFNASDFADPQHATGMEVINALNARLPGITASLRGGAVSIATDNVGGDEHLEVDLSLSSAAQALGFDISNAAADGDWGDGVDWQPPQEVASAPAGTAGAPVYHADLTAVTDAGGIVWLFWAMRTTGSWQIASTHWNGITWSTSETLSASNFGDREPGAAVDQANRIWLFWTRRKIQSGVAGRAPEDDSWTLWQRFFDGTWHAESELLASPAGRAADRQPACVRLSSGDLRIFFQSSRSGSADLWSTTFTPPAGTPAAPAVAVSGPASDQWPAPLLMPDGALWLLFRSDRGVSPSRVATQPLIQPDNRVTSPAQPLSDRSTAPTRSVRMPDTGTLHRFSGTTSVIPGDAARNDRHRQWDDLIAYTPQGIQDGGNLPDDALYTPGTVGLYLTQVVYTTALSLQRVDRLLAVLKRFLPVNVRVVVILAPRLDSEIVYGDLPDGSHIDIGEGFNDRYPYLENYPAVRDTTTAIMPGVLILHAADFNPANPKDISADPSKLATLQKRSYFPPLQ
jgi:phage tail-like protein